MSTNHQFSYMIIKQILDGSEFNKQFVGRRKVILDEVNSHVNCILNRLPSNICYIIYFYLYNLNVSMILMSDCEN